MTHPKIDLTGKRFGRLTVIRQADDYVYPNGKRRTQWECLCDCGNTITAEQSNLKRGNTNSCGCYNLDNIRTMSITHGGRHTRLYRIWSNMKTRCLDVNNKNYAKYGARGISVCDKWKNSFESFRDWALNNGYRDNLTIDRIDVNGGYFPENCRWANAKVQANNRRNNKTYEYHGEKHTLAELSDMYHIPYHTLYARVTRLGWDMERALAI